MPECVRTVYDFENPGRITTINTKEHSYSWSGKIPCTGVYRCIFCGYVKERNNQNEKD